ncbi:hypothetical protein FJTKL_14005 [Diaporthe vaccinii]|uniref:Uncharacterized protein n=1 Tax=Diaporthe vaccinii TaxID=105482 RepID=A0ABR4E9B8_9PEZI
MCSGRVLQQDTRVHHIWSSQAPGFAAPGAVAHVIIPASLPLLSNYLYAEHFSYSLVGWSLREERDPNRQPSRSSPGISHSECNASSQPQKKVQENVSVLMLI